MLSDRCLSCPVLSVCDVDVLWPNGWMNQDEIWHGGRPRPRRHRVTWGPSSPSPKEAQQPPLFGPCLLWPNCWMDQDATWYGGRTRPRPHCARWGPSSAQKKREQPPIFGPCLLWPNGRPSQLLLSTCYFILRIAHNPHPCMDRFSRSIRHMTC